MEKMSDLRDLLKHEIYDLQSAEEQIIKALPAMIEKANNGQLKTSLQRHLEITQKQLLRLDQVQGFLKDRSETQVNEKKGLLARLFKRNHLCKGMQGLIEEGEKIMAEEMSPEVLDAAIIASAQKIEHYEICGYGTARAFAKELNLMGVTQLLEETLNEEYEADDTLTELAVGRLNQKAESASANSDAGNIDRSPAKETPREISKIKEPEFEMVADQAKPGTNKKQSAKSRAPKGDAERSESQRETSSVRRTTVNSGNSKSVKAASRRKTTDVRSNTGKTKRSR
jgi:ferritin-like metal-binding protein YciE